MTAFVEEKWDSPRATEGDNPTIEHRYLVRGTTLAWEARWAVKLASPVIDASIVPQALVRQQIDIEPEEGTDDLWNAVVKYARKAKPETGQSEWFFDTTGGTAKITQSRETMGRYAPAGETPYDFQGAIGVTKDAVEGCEIIVPQFTFGETHYIAAAAVSWPYAAVLCGLTGKTNLSPFRAFAPGEVLFLGASGRKRGEDDWEITYKFSATPNLAGLMIGTIGPISKRGWDYLWVRYDEYSDPAGLVKRPAAVYVERVYDAGDFSALGIS